MRIAVSVILIASILGCTASRVVTPREYLDEQTAATITVVKDPWIFTRTLSESSATDEQDFLHLYAIDVNRMGDHRQYLAVLQSVPPTQHTAISDMPNLELTSGGETIALEATTASPRELGIAQPVAESYTMTAAWFYFPVDKQVLARIANTRDLDAAMVIDSERIPYVLWRDGRDELSELTAVLP
jgi:hypothetical protein